MVSSRRPNFVSSKMSRTIYFFLYLVIYSNDGHHVMSPLVVTMATGCPCLRNVKLHLHLNRQLWILEMNNDMHILEVCDRNLDGVKVK